MNWRTCRSASPYLWLSSGRSPRLDIDASELAFARRLWRQALDEPLRIGRKRTEAGADDAAVLARQRVEVRLEEIVGGGVGLGVQVVRHHLRDLGEELRPVAVRRVGAVALLDAADARLIRIDVIELVNHRVELRNPRIAGAPVEALLARARERLIAEPRQRKRDQVLDLARADRHDRRLGDEPLRTARDRARVRGRARSSSPVRSAAGSGSGRSRRRLRRWIGRIARRRAVGDVDERQDRHARDDVLHQQRETFGVVDHALAPDTTTALDRIRTHPALPDAGRARSLLTVMRVTLATVNSHRQAQQSQKPSNKQ